MVVKVFDGPRAKEVKNSHSTWEFINRNACRIGSAILDWLKTFCEYHLRSFVSSNDSLKPSHSNVPKIVGISGGNRTESPFIVFHGSEFQHSPTHILMGISVSDRKMNSLLAKALRTDLNKSVQLSMKTVSYLVGDRDVV